MSILECSRVRMLALTVLLASPHVAAADPVPLTSGYVETQIFSSLARGVLEGEGFLMGFGADAFRASVALECSPCAPGSMVNLGAAFNLPRSAGRAVVDGVTYPEIHFDGMTGTFSAPSFRITGAETVTVTTPFSYSGVVSGYLMDPWVHGLTEPSFTKTLLGGGTATATFFYTFNEEDGPLFSATDLRYDFGDTAPVPEPATLLLFGAGTAALALRRRRQLQKTIG